LHNEIRTRRPPLDNLETKILAILDKSRFESAHSIAERLFVVYPTVLRYLHDSIGFKLFHFHWVPHLLINDLREKRKTKKRKTKGACKSYAAILAYCQT
jgi:hypothetical protein